MLLQLLLLLLLLLLFQDPNSSRSTMIGVGFREREQAFDFKNCLNEYVRFIDRQHRAQHLAAAPLKGAAAAQSADSGDDEANDDSYDLHSAATPAAQVTIDSLPLPPSLTPLLLLHQLLQTCCSYHYYYCYCYRYFYICSSRSRSSTFCRSCNAAAIAASRGAGSSEMASHALCDVMSENIIYE